VHPRFKTPYVAILLAAVLGIALVMSRSFEALTETFVLAIWPFYALGIAHLPPAPPAARAGAPVQSDRLPGRACDLHPLGRRVRHQRTHQPAGVDQHHLRAHPRGHSVYNFAFAKRARRG
jgi:hypothetical protein